MKKSGKVRNPDPIRRVTLDRVAGPDGHDAPSVRIVDRDGRTLARFSLDDLSLLAGKVARGDRRRGILDTLSLWASILARIGQFILALMQALRLFG